MTTPPAATDKMSTLDRLIQAQYALGYLITADGAREELESFRDQSDSWLKLMREIAKLSDALDLDDDDWAAADDSTLLEQFDPWTVIAAALNNIIQHPYHEACPQCWARYQSVVKERDVCIDELKHRVAVDTLKVVEQFYARVCARAEETIAHSHQVSGAHYAAMQVELAALRTAAAYTSCRRHSVSGHPT